MGSKAVLARDVENEFAISSMTHRFYCPNLAATGSVTLADSEAHHLSHVLRHHNGDLVELFDGKGLAASCQIQSIGKREVTLSILSSHHSAKTRPELILATAVPKGDRCDWLVEKATELGVSRLIPLNTQRSVVDPRSSKLDKLRQTVITASKQSGRNHLMSISEVTTWSDLLKQFANNEYRFFVGHPNGKSLTEELKATQNSACPIVAAIGPEGGLTDNEVQMAKEMGAKAVHLGNLLLRIETAAIAIAARILI